MDSRDISRLTSALSTSTKAIQDAQALGSTVLAPVINLHCSTVYNVLQAITEESIYLVFFDVGDFYRACGLTSDGRFPENVSV